MRKLAMKKIPAPLDEYIRHVEDEPIILTANGRPVAAIVALPNADPETVSLSTNPRFIALIERSRRRQGREGGISPDEMRRRLELRKKRSRH